MNLLSKPVKLAWLAVFIIGTASILVACNNSRSLLSDAGPVMHGLRLHLHIESTHTDTDLHKITLSIINTSADTITLKDVSFGGPRPGQNYADMMPESTIFISHPYVMSHSFQTGGTSGLPRPTQTLAAGGMVQSKWTVIDNIFEGYETNTSLTLPMNGLYFLRAHLTVRTSDDQQIVLWSNEAPCSIGGSYEAPLKCSAKISSVADDHSVTFNIGAQHGVQIGDRYSAKYYAPTHLKEDTRWVTFTVTQVFPTYCIATPLPGGRLAGREGANPWFPERNFQVFLVRSPQMIRPPVIRPPTKQITQEPEWPEIDARRRQPVPEK